MAPKKVKPPAKWEYWEPEPGQYVRVLRVSRKAEADFKVGDVVRFGCNMKNCLHRVSATGNVRRNGEWFYLCTDSSETATYGLAGVVHCCPASPDEEAAARLREVPKPGA